MSNTKNLNDQKGVEKLQELAESIRICLFCTDLQTNDGATARPMSVQVVDDHGNLWFFSGKDSDKNHAIKHDKQVQLYFAHPGQSSYMVVNGEAEIIVDQAQFELLWSPLVETWFKGGKDDPNLSLIKVNTSSAYYWDTDGNKMINFFKMVMSVATGTNLVAGKEGEIKV